MWIWVVVLYSPRLISEIARRSQVQRKVWVFVLLLSKYSESDSELARRSQAQMWVLGCRLFALRVLCEAMISELARRSQVQMWVCG